MRSTGIVRRVDELGRVVLPSELRKTFGIGDKDALEIYIDNEMIILKKYEPACIFTGEASDLIEYRGRKVSKMAVQEMAAIMGLQKMEEKG